MHFPGNSQAEIREFPDPHAGPGEAVVKIRASGLCGTDLHRYRSSQPVDMITGHEPCGGVVIIKDGAILGEIGVGGLRGHSADEDLAKLGLEAMNL